MAIKIFRVVVATSLDQDIISFLESIPATRRSELLRHIIRFYVSQMDNTEELFIVSDYSPSKPIQLTTKKDNSDNSDIEYKIRLDERIDQPLIDIAEQVPRKRRSEFWRHVFRYYIGHLNEGDVFIMPIGSTFKEKNSHYTEVEEDISDRRTPGDELDGLDFSL